MKRRGILGALIGLAGGVAAKAQVLKLYVPPDTVTTTALFKPKNNECPVCGTIAPTVPMLTEMNMKNCRNVPGSKYLIQCDPAGYIPGKSQVDCSFCRTVFYQDWENPDITKVKAKVN